MGIGDTVGGFIKDLVSSATGDLAKDIIGLIRDYWPADISPQQKAELEMAVKEYELKKSLQINEEAIQAREALTAGISELEGSAADLKTIPIVGPIMIFLRGCQRPVWGFACLYFDYMYFFSNNKIMRESEKIEIMLLIINLLVLTFLFGERGMRNLIPLVKGVFGRSKND